ARWTSCVTSVSADPPSFSPLPPGERGERRGKNLLASDPSAGDTATWPRASPAHRTYLPEGPAMRLCPYHHNGNVEAALYEDTRIVSLNRLAAELGVKLPTPMSDNLLDYLPPEGKSARAVRDLAERFAKMAEADQTRLSLPLKGAKLRVPIPEPK